MKFWQSIAFAEPEQLTGIARAAEEAGFDGLLIPDHLFFPGQLTSKYPYAPDGKPMFGPETPWPEPWSAIAAMAAVTTTLRFAIGVYILPLRRPLEVAKASSTVAVLSQDRVALGVGSGWMREEYLANGEDFGNRGRRLDEMIAVLRKVWAGGMVEHHGEFYDFAPLQMSPAPRRPLPIWVGGTSGPALRRAARTGDGWIGAGNTPDEVPAVMDRLRTLRREAGREHEPFETIVAVNVPPDVDMFRRLEDAGVTAIVSWPFAYTVGPASSLDDQSRELARYGRDIIAAMR